MRLNPIEVLEDFNSGYLGYLETHFSTRYDYLNEKIIRKKEEEGRFIKGPYIQLTPPYEKGTTLQDLVDEGILHPDIVKIFGNIQLYTHQEKVIRNIFETGRNAFIATGTGSGKTLSFLIPVINYILKIKTNPELSEEAKKGVKAIFMYPMNALANDQINTLRNIIIKAFGKGVDVPITFGKYTGETPEDAKDYNKKTGRDYKDDKSKCPNHLLTRQEILQNPPDILITNYSMLEFLLLRPKETSLFSDKNYKFIVIDEIHVYDGAKGTEIGYLLRKLKARAFTEDPICIGASATIGEINEDNLKKASEFAEGIFGEPFDKQDVITSNIIDIKPDGDLWYEDIDFEEILKRVDDVESLKDYLENLGLPGKVEGLDTGEVLFNFFKNYEPVYYLRNKLKENPYPLQDLLKDEENPVRDGKKLVNLISLLFRAKIDLSGTPLRLLDARYHIFLKGIEGLYASLNDSGNKEVFKNVYLEKTIKDVESEDERKVFQLCSCSNCGEVFLTGYESPLPGENAILLEVDPSLLSDPFKIDRYKRLFVYIPSEGDKDKIDPDSMKGDRIWFDPIAGKIYFSKPAITSNMWEGYLLKEDGDLNQPEECPNCGMSTTEAGGKNYWVSYFTPESEYPQANILEILYKKVAQSARNEKEKKILVFSDSRKDAAFFAPFFENYYENRKLRWILYNSLKEIKDVKFDSLVNASVDCLGDRGKKFAFIEKLLGEFGMLYPDSFEKVGLVKFYLDPKISEKIVNSLLNIPIFNSLSKDEINALIHYLLKDSRSLRHITHEDFTKERIDEIYALAYVWKNKPPKVRSSTSWLPSSKKGNKRTRLLEKIFSEISYKDAVDILSKIWDVLEDNNIFEFTHQKGYQIVASNWYVKSIEEEDKIYRCNVCRKIHLWNVKNACRDGNCKGMLEKVSLDSLIEAKGIISHFKPVECREYKKMGMKISEHTAQLSTEEGQKIQKDFEEGKINILSCSTTFELGVDLGELEVVFLHNIPPRPDNYVQRAGRAGRSADSVALVCSYALNRPLDLKAFENPIDMIKGSIRPPVVKVTNSRIILRHLNSIALSIFLRKIYSGVNRISIGDFYNSNKFKEFENFMNTDYFSEVKPVIDKVLIHPDLRKEFGVDTKAWWDGKIPYIEEKNSLEFWQEIKKEYEEEIKPLDDEIKKLQGRLIATTKTKEQLQIISMKNYYESIKKQKENEDLITFLSRKVFIPKYGFPVDVVELEVKNETLQGKVQLDRDLGIAIGEYAPLESVIVLGNKVLSTKVKMYPSLKPEVRKYYYCKACLAFDDVAEHESLELKEKDPCPVCGVEGIRVGKYLIPKYGFTNENIFKWTKGRDYNKEIVEQLTKKFKVKKDDKGVARKLSVLFKEIPSSKLRSFYKGISASSSESKIKESIEYGNGNIRTTPYKRGEIVKLNISERRMVSTDKGINIRLYSEDSVGELREDNKLANLGYKFYTDVLVVEISDNLVKELKDIAMLVEDFNTDQEKEFAVYMSVLYALIEGASKALEIKRDDIDGTLKINGGKYDFVLYDDVPAGAGFVVEIHDNFNKVLEAAYDISKNCSCDKETACSICLLHTRNQSFAKFIKRGLAANFIEKVIM